jgi:aspartate dehydrogenase
MAQPVTAPLRVGLIGAGTIGRAVADSLREPNGPATLAWICTRNVEKARAWAGDVPVLTELDEALARPADLVVEAALPDVMRTAVPRFLERCDVMPFTLTPLADRSLYERLESTALRGGTRLILPKGAIIGLDGIIAARPILSSVRITTVKSPESLGLAPQHSGELFSGSTRDGVGRFPRNTNVHVAVALAGVGLDRTHSVVKAEPGLKTMRHLIEVEGEGLAWSIGVESMSLGGVSGAFVPLSAAASVRGYRRKPAGIHFG